MRHRTQRGQINANVSSTKDTEADVVTGNAEEEVSSDHKLKPEKLTEKRRTMEKRLFTYYASLWREGDGVGVGGVQQII